MKSSWFIIVFFLAAIFAATAVAISPHTPAKAMDPKSKSLARGEYPGGSVIQPPPAWDAPRQDAKAGGAGSAGGKGQ